MHHVGDECAGDGCLGFTLCAVIDERPCRFERGAGVRQVVRESLLPFGSARLRESQRCASQKCGNPFDDGCGGGEVFDGVVHEVQR